MQTTSDNWDCDAQDGLQLYIDFIYTRVCVCVCVYTVCYTVCVLCLYKYINTSSICHECMK